MKNNYKMATFDVPNEKIKDARYLIQVTTNENVFIGFSGGEGKIFTQFFIGNEKRTHVTKQVPKLFKTKKECVKEIDNHQKYDKAFNQKHNYIVVPIDINV